MGQNIVLSVLYTALPSITMTVDHVSGLKAQGKGAIVGPETGCNLNRIPVCCWFRAAGFELDSGCCMPDLHEPWLVLTTSNHHAYTQAFPQEDTAALSTPKTASIVGMGIEATSQCFSSGSYVAGLSARRRAKLLRLPAC